MNTHEDLSRRDEVTGSSDRSFGLTFSVFWGIVAFLPFWHHQKPRLWALVLAGGMLLVSLLRPSIFHRANRHWTYLALLLSRVVNPVVLGVLFYGVMTPIAIMRRLSGNDSMKLRFDPKSSSYWLERIPPGPPPESMERQF
jgi:Saxitoxin biosynthesis operon protein SxtJ